MVEFANEKRETCSPNSGPDGKCRRYELQGIGIDHDARFDEGRQMRGTHNESLTRMIEPTAPMQRNDETSTPAMPLFRLRMFHIIAGAQRT